MICYRTLILFLLSLSFSTVAAKAHLKKTCVASCEEDVKQHKICTTVRECTRKRCTIWARNWSTNNVCCSNMDCTTPGYECRAKKCVAPLSTPYPTRMATPPPTGRPTRRPTRSPTPPPTTPMPTAPTLRRATPAPTPRPTTPMPTTPTPPPSPLPTSIPIEQAMIADAFSATVPATFLERFPDQVFQQIMQDSPSGFVPGFLMLENLNVDFPDFDAEIPIMDFEVSGAGDSLRLDGKFIPSDPLVTIPDGTVVRIYAQDGLHATSIVDVESGYFRTAITGIPPGGIPILFTFSSPFYDGNSGTPIVRNLLSTALGPGTFPSPSYAYVKNPNKCAPALTFTLAWDGPTSDIDLRVLEPSGGREVYFNHKIGAYGSLDVDDTNGYGPENYFAPTATSGEVFRARVHAFWMKSDDIVVWTLQARTNGRLLWIKTGTFTSSNEYSESFEVEIGEAGRQLSDSCGHTCPPTYTKSGWCSFWNWYEHDECDNHAQIDLYNMISSMQSSPSKEDQQLIVHLLFLPAVIKMATLNFLTPSINQYEHAIDAIADSNDMICTTGFILEAVCEVANKETSFRALQFVLGAMKTLETVAPFFAGSGFLYWTEGYMQYMESLGTFTNLDKDAILIELNAIATADMIDSLASKLLTCV